MSIFVYVTLGIGCVRNGLGIVPAGAMFREEAVGVDRESG